MSAVGPRATPHWRTLAAVVLAHALAWLAWPAARWVVPAPAGERIVWQWRVPTPRPSDEAHAGGRFDHVRPTTSRLDDRAARRRDGSVAPAEATPGPSSTATPAAARAAAVNVAPVVRADAEAARPPARAVETGGPGGASAASAPGGGPAPTAVGAEAGEAARSRAPTSTARALDLSLPAGTAASTRKLWDDDRHRFGAKPASPERVVRIAIGGQDWTLHHRDADRIVLRRGHECVAMERSRFEQIRPFEGRGIPWGVGAAYRCANDDDG